MGPNTTAMGVDISGLTIEEAKATLEKELPRRWADQAIELYEPGSGIRLYVGAYSLMEPVDLEQDLRQACRTGPDGRHPESADPPAGHRRE